MYPGTRLCARRHDQGNKEISNFLFLHPVFPFFGSPTVFHNGEKVAAATSAPKVYQQYIRGDDDWLDGEVQRAINAGFDLALS